jgi:hypothetical protein
MTNASSSSPPSPSSLLSADEQAKAADYLISTRDNLLQSLRNLAGEQCDFKPAPEQWSIAEVLEHVVLIETRIHDLIGKMPEAPEAEPDRDDQRIDGFILANLHRRSRKVQAPPNLLPARRWSPAEMLEQFSKSRGKTLELLAEAPALRGHVFPHPLFGPWDGYQWLLALAGHTARHTDQILELKSHAAFPGVWGPGTLENKPNR